MMEILVSYDVSTEDAAGRRRLRRVAKICLAHGQRVQKSVFECSLTDVQYAKMEARLAQSIDPAQDNLRIYRLREPRAQYVKSFGIDPWQDFNGPLVL